MARTPEYRQQTRASRGAQLPRNVAADSPLPQGGIEAAGNAIAGHIERRRQQAEEAATRKELQFALTDGIKSESDWQTYADEAVRNAKPDGTGLVDDFNKKYGEYLPKAMAGYKTEDGRARAEVVQQRIFQNTRDNLAKAQAGLLASDSDRRRREALGDAERLVNIDPSRYGALEATATALAAELPGLSTEQRQAFAGEQRGRLALAAGYGAVTQNPYSTLKELSKEKPTAPWAQHLELGDAMRLRSAAQSEVNRRESDARSARVEAQSILRGDLQDAFAARSFGAPSQLPSRSRFVAAFGAEGAERYNEAQTRWSIYDVVGEASLQSPAEAQATLAKLRPATQEGAAAQGESYQAAVQLYTQQRAQLEADPVAVLSQRDPQVKAAREAALADPKNIGAYFSTLRARQEVLGVEKPKLLPETQRTQIAAGLQFDPNAPLKRVQTIATLRQSYGDAFPAVMEEVAPKLDGVARVLINMEPKYAVRLDAAFAQRDKFKDIVPPKTRTDISAEVQRLLTPFAATLHDNPDGPSRIAEHVDAAELLAQQLVSSGSTNPQEAARVAADAVINSQFSFIGDLRIPAFVTDKAGNRAPSGFNPGRISLALGQKKATLASAGSFVIEANRLSTPKQAQEDMRNLIERSGYWVTNENGTGVVLRIPHRGGLSEVFAVMPGKDPAGFPIDTTRPRIENADGSFSTERTITVGFEDRFYNIPTIWDGKELSPEQAIGRARASLKKGETFPNFGNEADAERAAVARSAAIEAARAPRRIEFTFEQLNAPFAFDQVRSLNDPLFVKVK